MVRNWTLQICDLKLFLIFYSLENGCQVEIKIVYIVVIFAIEGTQINYFEIWWKILGQELTKLSTSL